MDGETDRLMKKKTGRYIERQINGLMDKLIDGQID